MLGALRMKKLLSIQISTLLFFFILFQIKALSDENVSIKLVCNDTADPSLPLSVEIYNSDTVKLAKVGNFIGTLSVSSVMYTIKVEDEGIYIFATIQRNDGRFNAEVKIGNRDTIDYNGFCKKNEPLF